MSNTKIKNAEELETLLENTLAQQLEHQKNGNYVDAQHCRLKVEQLKKDLDSRRLFQMDQKHKQDQQDLDRKYNDDLNKFNKFWNQKIDEYAQEGQRMQNEMQARHQEEQQKLKNDLQRQLPLKVKQSSQLLNLRKMEEHMAKQKNYVEAHRVQTKISELEKLQKDAWMQSRDTKIQTALNQMKIRQNTELNNLRKRIQTGLQEQAKDRHLEQTRMNQKYSNSCRQMKSLQQKQVLSYLGQFRTKGGQSSSPTMTKSKVY